MGTPEDWSAFSRNEDFPIFTSFEQNVHQYVLLRVKIVAWHVGSSANRMTSKTNLQCLRLWFKGLAMSAFFCQSSIANLILLKWWVIYDCEMYSFDFFFFFQYWGWCKYWYRESDKKIFQDAKIALFCISMHALLKLFDDLLTNLGVLWALTA